jgi:dTDP-4-dehydrorhamnose 3,5-epimerase
MQFIEAPIKGLIEIIPTLFRDDRGWFYESFKEPNFKSAGIPYTFVQENQSFSRKGVIRGLHFQQPPYAQAKLASVALGKVLDVVVDLRPGSKTFGEVYTCILDSQKRNMLMVPEGFAHGFSALEDSVFCYKCSNLFHKASEAGITWKDPDLRIDWQIDDPIVSEKDQLLPTLAELLRNSVISRG